MGIAEWMGHKERRAPAAAPVAVKTDDSIVIMEQINRLKNVKIPMLVPVTACRVLTRTRRRARQGACSTRTRALYHAEAVDQVNGH